MRYGLTGTLPANAAFSTLQLDARLATLFVDRAQIVGLDEPKENLTRLLLNQNMPNLSFFSVVGAGGLGKTTLAKIVYESIHSENKDHFHCRCWITVSQSVNIEGILRDMIRQLVPVIPPALDMMERNKLIEQLRRHLQDKRYFVVFDDVWSISAWEILKLALPENELASRVV